MDDSSEQQGSGAELSRFPSLAILDSFRTGIGNRSMSKSRVRKDLKAVKELFVISNI